MVWAERTEEERQDSAENVGGTATSGGAVAMVDMVAATVAMAAMAGGDSVADRPIEQAIALPQR